MTATMSYRMARFWIMFKAYFFLSIKQVIEKVTMDGKLSNRNPRMGELPKDIHRENATRKIKN